MRVEPGCHRRVASNGVEINVDQDLSQELTDLVVGFMERAGLTPTVTFAVSWDNEGAVTIEHLELDAEGRAKYDPESDQFVKRVTVV